MPHIISVDNKETFEHFLHDGYIGVRLPAKYYKKIKKGALEKRDARFLLGTIYDIFADLKRVKIGDEIFIHVKGEQRVFGVFRAASTFLESPEIPEEFGSQNLLKEKLVGRSLPSLSEKDFLWQVSIKESDKELYFIEGFDANEIFKLKDLCQGIWTIPERWKYEDKEKTVRPLLPEEGEKLIELLKKYNPNGPSKSHICQKSLKQFKEIKLPLAPIDGYVRDEKLIEAWIMANALNPEVTDAYENIKGVFGDFSFIANTLRSFYIKFMDVFGYFENTKSKEYKIIEIKTKEALKEHVDQLFKYVQWIAEFLCGNDLNRVKGFLVAKEFPVEVSQLLKKNKHGNLRFVQYSLADGRLVFKKFAPEHQLANFFKSSQHVRKSFI
jgi:hypothetical protein